MDNKQIFLTKCYCCGKRIAVMVDKNRFCNGAYSCNNCVPENSCARNGIDEACETDLFDKYKL